MADVFDENRMSDPTWDLPDVNKDGTLQPNLVSESAENIFTINDVVLKIPPTHISIRNEDLVWKWKTLRTKNSTKIASGNGMCDVVLDIVLRQSYYYIDID